MKFSLDMFQYIFYQTIRRYEIICITADWYNYFQQDRKLRDVLHEYYGNNEISYTADVDSEIWSEVLAYLNKDCKLIKDIELQSGLVTIYETDVVNEFLVRFEFDNGRKNFLFWRNRSLC